MCLFTTYAVGTKLWSYYKQREALRKVKAR